MRVREYVDRCPTCAEVTSHTRRPVRLPPVVAAILLVLAGGWVVTGGTAAVMLAAPPAVLALALWRQDAREAWHLACNRCRLRESRRLRVARPKLLSRNTEIHL